MARRIPNYLKDAQKKPEPKSVPGRIIADLTQQAPHNSYSGNGGTKSPKVQSTQRQSAAALAARSEKQVAVLLAIRRPINPTIHRRPNSARSRLGRLRIVAKHPFPYRPLRSCLRPSAQTSAESFSMTVDFALCEHQIASRAKGK